MKAISLRVFNAFLALVVILSMFSGAVRVTAQTTPPSPLEILAASRKLDAKDLSLLNETTFTLLDGHKVQRIKALDTRNGQIIGGDFENGLEVNLAALEATAGASWRAAHGALTPQSLIVLSTLAPADTVNISLWLAGDIQALPHDEFKPDLASTPGQTNNIEASTDQSSGPAVVPLGNKDFIVPLTAGQIPPEVLAAAPGSISAPGSQIQEAQHQELTPALPAADADGKIEAFKQANQRHLETQVTALQSALRPRLESLGLHASYASTIVPSTYLENVPRALVEKMAFWPEIDAIYIVPKQAGPALDSARPAQNANIVNNSGYIGTGVTVAVTEGERAYFANPGLTMNNCYDCSQDYANHPTAVAGFIKSTVFGYYGLANGATVDSANGSYSNWATQAAAIDWATTNDTILTNSWYWDSPNTSTFWEADRRLDYIVRYNYDFVAVAAGNFGNGCSSNWSSYVVSPAKGYNVLSVGNHEDQDNINWSDDAMDVCSSFGNPSNDTTGTAHEKPEVSAIGSTLDSTLPVASAPLVGPVGSGTSYASPMVAALAADLIQAKSTLSNKPEALRAIIMATALQNIEGSAITSDKDGAGAVDFTAALITAERNHFSSQYVASDSTYPITFYQSAYQGERMRFVITWLSNPSGPYTTDVLPADLDLTAYRADGTTVVAISSNSTNNFEVLDFIAPASETYIFKVTNYSFTGSGTWLGASWWRGEYRISPGTLYSDPLATPLGTLLSIYPADWAHSNYWRALGTRSTSSDHDLKLYSAGLAENPSTRSTLAISSSSLPLDFIVVDGNHSSSSQMEHYQVVPFSGTGGYTINWSNNYGTLSPGIYGPFTKTSSLPVETYDLSLNPGYWRITVIPSLANTVDLGVYAFTSTSGTPSSWAQGKYLASSRSDVSTNALVSEGLYLYAANSDYYGLVVTANTNGYSDYYIKIDSLVFLPVLMRQP